MQQNVCIQTHKHTDVCLQSYGQQTHQRWRDDYCSLDSSLLSPPLSDTLIETHTHTFTNPALYEMVLILPCVCVCATHPVQLDEVDPLVSVLGVLSSEVPHAVVHADVQPALVKLMGLKEKTQGHSEISVISLNSAVTVTLTRSVLQSVPERSRLEAWRSINL